MIDILGSFGLICLIMILTILILSLADKLTGNYIAEIFIKIIDNFNKKDEQKTTIK